MLTRVALVIVLLCLNVPEMANAQTARKRELWDWLTTQTSQIEFEKIKPFQAIYILLSIAQSCHTLEQKELAGKYLQLARTIADKDKPRSHHFRLFTYAINVGDMELAEEIAKASASESLLDRLDLERFRRGDRAAIKDYPRGKMTFYNAMELARVYVEQGDYKRAEEFVTDIEISEENDPRAVTGMILEEIAKRYRAKGDLENAKRYIDKAVAVAGNLFYTGYGIQVMHRSIHGELAKDLEQFAQRGANLRGHMGRELVQILVYELIRTGYFEEAKRTARLLDKSEDVHSCMQALASEQAKRGDITAALKTVEELDDPLARSRARLGIAEVLQESGNRETAKKMADFLLRGLTKEMDAEGERHCQRLAKLYGALKSQAEIEQLVALAQTPPLKAQCIAQAIQGVAASKQESRAISQ